MSTSSKVVSCGSHTKLNRQSDITLPPSPVSSLCVAFYVEIKTGSVLRAINAS